MSQQLLNWQPGVYHPAYGYIWDEARSWQAVNSQYWSTCLWHPVARKHGNHQSPWGVRNDPQPPQNHARQFRSRQEWRPGRFHFLHTCCFGRWQVEADACWRRCHPLQVSFFSLGRGDATTASAWCPVRCYHNVQCCVMLCRCDWIYWIKGRERITRESDFRTL